MKLRVLGCSGGVAAGLSTTSYLIDDDILLDVGTGVGDLSMAELLEIKDVFITHSHMDHICGLPLIADTLFGNQDRSLRVHAHPDTIKALMNHVFNWVIWPDFTEIEYKGIKGLEFVPMQHGETVEVRGRKIEMIPVVHTVPCVGYRVESVETGKALAFSGDTATNDSFWEALNKHDSLDLLMVECGFPDEYDDIADLSKHYCPKTLAADLEKLDFDPPIGISHLKPGHEAGIVWEIAEQFPGHNVLRLSSGDEFNL